MSGEEIPEEKETPRIVIKSKWTQGSQLVLNLQLNYEGSTRKVQSSCPLTMVENEAQFKAFLEEVYEVNAPQTKDLSKVPTEVM